MATKAEVVAKLGELDIEHDASKSKAELESLLPAQELAKLNLEEDAPHAAMREIIEAYKESNPRKYELKKDEFARKLSGKLRFSNGPDGRPLDGHVDPITGRRIPLQVEIVK